MIGFLCLFVCVNNPIDLEQNKAKKANTFSSQKDSKQEFFGSLVYDDNGNLIFQHFPSGEVKPAILYMHRLSFIKRSDKLKAYKYIGKNVHIKGDVLKIKDMEIILVENIEVLLLEV